MLFLLFLLLFDQGRNNPLALFLDFLREPGMPLLDEAGGKPELEQSHGERGGEIVKVGADLGELQRLAGLVAQLDQRFSGFLVEEGLHLSSLANGGQWMCQNARPVDKWRILGGIRIEGKG